MWTEKKFLRQKKNCQTEVVNFQNYFEKSKNSLPIFEQFSHFWTRKMQNLESRQQNYLNHKIWYMRNDGIK